MAKKAPKKEAPTASVFKHQAALDRKLEAQKIQGIQESAFAKGKHMALRAAAKQAGYTAGLKQAGIQAKPTNGKLKKKR